MLQGIHDNWEMESASSATSKRRLAASCTRQTWKAKIARQTVTMGDRADISFVKVSKVMPLPSRSAMMIAAPTSAHAITARLLILAPLVGVFEKILFGHLRPPPVRRSITKTDPLGRLRLIHRIWPSTPRTDPDATTPALAVCNGYPAASSSYSSSARSVAIKSVITDSDPKRQARPIAGQRFRCSVEANGVRCGGIGLPTTQFSAIRRTSRHYQFLSW